MSANTTTGTVSGTPNGPSGAISFTVMLADSSGFENDYHRQLLDHGQPRPPQLSVTPASLSFGNVPRFSLLFRTVYLKERRHRRAGSISRASVTPGAGTEADEFTPLSVY